MREQITANTAPAWRTEVLTARDEALEFVRRGEAVPEHFKSSRALAGWR